MEDDNGKGGKIGNDDCGNNARTMTVPMTMTMMMMMMTIN